MAQSQLALYNMALAVCGHDYTIADVAEESIAAETCELFYENVRQVLLRSAFWNSSKRFARLVEEAERDPDEDWVTSDPVPGYAFSYELPASLLAARYLTDFAQFELSYDNDSKILATNGGSDTASERPVLCFSIDVTDVTLWEPDLYQAMYYALAAHITMPLTGKVARRQANLQLAYDIVMGARANAANEIHRLFQYHSEVLMARGYTYGPSTPYVAPYGSWYNLTAVPTR